MRKANICCGTDIRESWDNFDKNPVDDRVQYLDINKPFPIKDDTYDIIVLNHGLEHSDINQFEVIKELWRITKKDGEVYLELPLFSPMACHNSFYHPNNYFDFISKRKTDKNNNFTKNLFDISYSYSGKRNTKKILYYMINRYKNWVKSFFYDNINFDLKVKK